MKAIELLKPHREDYANDIEWLDACAHEVRIYNRKLTTAIDRDVKSFSNVAKGGHLTEREKEAIHANTIHDYLQSHPLLMARYKQIGIGAFLEL